MKKRKALAQDEQGNAQEQAPEKRIPTLAEISGFMRGLRGYETA
jgi:hypothetical protein